MISRHRAELRFGLCAFVAIVATATLVMTAWRVGSSLTWSAPIALLSGLTWTLLPRKLRRRWSRKTWRLVVRRGEHVKASLKAARVLASPSVVDGDTVDDKATGVRYRLAGIDAPETEQRATCYSERKFGERAKAEACRLIAAAGRVEARSTGRLDVYERAVAYVYVDGRDLGDVLIARGLARPWRSGKKPWCGPDGDLLKMARKGRATWRCPTCGVKYEPTNHIRSLWHVFLGRVGW